MSYTKKVGDALLNESIIEKFKECKNTPSKDAWQEGIKIADFIAELNHLGYSIHEAEKIFDLLIKKAATENGQQ